MAVISQKCLKISAVNNYFQLRSILPREKLTFDGVNVLMLLLWSYKHRMTNDRHLHWEWHWITTTFYYKQPLNSCFCFNFFPAPGFVLYLFCKNFQTKKREKILIRPSRIWCLTKIVTITSPASPNH